MKSNNKTKNINKDNIKKSVKEDKNRYKVSVLNNIREISQSISIDIKTINSVIQKKQIKVYKNDFLFFTECEELFKYFNINYYLSNVCKSSQSLKEYSEKQECVSKVITIGVMGHVNHGKTTFISEITKNAIKEEIGITQSLSIYLIDNVYIFDTPGHEIFGSIRSHILSSIDFILLTISLGDGIEYETQKIIDLILKNSMQHRTIVLFTKKDIKKYEAEDIIKQMQDNYKFNPADYVVKENINESWLKIKTIVNEIYSIEEAEDKYKYDGIVINAVNIDNSIFILIKINKGLINKNTSLAFNKKIVRISRILDITNNKNMSSLDSTRFAYIKTDIELNSEDKEFYICNDKDLSMLYNKYCTYLSYLDEQLDNNTAVYNTVAINKVIFFVNDNITADIIRTLISKYTISNRSKIVNNITNAIIGCINKDDDIVIFNNSVNIQKYPQLANRKNIFNFSSIYELINYLEENNGNILDNVKIQHLSEIIKIFDIKGTKIYGCNVLRGKFNMKDKVLITQKKNEKGSFILLGSIPCSIISIKKNKIFIKTTKKNDTVGFIMQGLGSYQLEVGAFIYKI